MPCHAAAAPRILSWNTPGGCCRYRGPEKFGVKSPSPSPSPAPQIKFGPGALTIVSAGILTRGGSNFAAFANATASFDPVLGFDFTSNSPYFPNIR